MFNFRKFAVLTIILHVFLFITACNLEDFEPSTKLNPTRNLTITSSNNLVYLNFYAQNEESGFAGYNVFIGPDENTVLSMSNVISNANNLLPYASMPVFSIASNITIVVTYDNNNTPFTTGHVHYFAVTAYNSIYTNNSTIFEVKPITIQ